jgi:hypothetical protein
MAFARMTFARMTFARMTFARMAFARMALAGTTVMRTSSSATATPHRSSSLDSLNFDILDPFKNFFGGKNTIWFHINLGALAVNSLALHPMQNA